MRGRGWDQVLVGLPPARLQLLHSLRQVLGIVAECRQSHHDERPHNVGPREVVGTELTRLQPDLATDNEGLDNVMPADVY